MADHGPSRLLLALPALPGAARPRIRACQKCITRLPGGQRIALPPQRRTDRFASPDLGFWFDEGIPYDPPNMSTCKQLLFLMCAAINLLSCRIILHRIGAPGPVPQPWKFDRLHTRQSLLNQPNELDASPDRSIYRAAHAAPVALAD